MFFRFGIAAFSFLFLFNPQLSAQGIFRAFGFATTVTATGQTELVGSVHLALTLGSTLADTLVIDLSPFQITNANTPDIQIAAAGNLTAGTVTIDSVQTQVHIPINGGATSGSLRVDGIRIAMAGTNASSVSARPAQPNRANYLERDSVVVADRVRSGLVVDPMTDKFRIVGNTIIDNSGRIVLHEGYETAFTNALEFGQNSATRVRIRVTDFPSGLTLKFPASISAEESSATLTTVEGTAIDLPRPNGNTEVIYTFGSAANSKDLTETFKITFNVTISGNVQLLQPTIAVSLAPIGAAQPSAAFPATNVPRYAEENLIALEGTSLIITKTLYWTGIDGSVSNKLSMFNPTSTTANLTLTGFDADGKEVTGANVTNPLKHSLLANQSLNVLLTDLFGSSSSSITTVRVQSTNSEVVGLGTTTGPGISDSVILVDRGLPTFDLPVIGGQARFHFFNPLSSAVTGTLNLLSPSGVALGSTTISLASMSSVSRSLQDLFGTTTGAHVTGSFSTSVVAFEHVSGETMDSAAAQAAVGVAALYIPFIASGGGYQTEINLINRSDDTVTVMAQLFDSQGVAVGSGRPISLVPAQQFVGMAADLFQQQTFMTGYVRIQVPQFSKAFWTYYPAISGHARIRSSQSGSTVLPLSAYPQTESSILNSGSLPSQYQGIAIVNPTTAQATVTLQAIGSTGTLLATATVNLGPGQISSRLISEYFTITIPESSVIRVSSTAPIVTTSITGSLNGDTLRSTPGLR